MALPYDWSGIPPDMRNQSAADTARRAQRKTTRANLKPKEPPQQWGYPDTYSYYPTYGPKVYLTQGIIFDFYNYSRSPTPIVIAGGNALRKGLFVRPGSNRLLRLLLSVLPFNSGLPSNSPQYTYFGLNETLGMWYGIHRNITADFQTHLWNSQCDTLRIRNHVGSDSPSSPTGLTKTVV